ncbi:unnamed protein product [Danaus chrysippus]|uniref:(African queen) hypothetical protein n=1 Tax=Danaus chrysippus TaxID=151541 RepID=A0A8J2VVD4_9NEOP|nr:unnamed protein product [Danaus chrysippus]
MDVSIGGVSYDSGKLVRGGGAPHPYSGSGYMEPGFSELDVARREPMDSSIEAMHPLDPPPPDVLLALLARNKALEGIDSLYNKLN